MFADTLLRAQQLHLLRLLAWGGGSVVAGTTVLIILRWRDVLAPLLQYFAFQLIGWGAVELACVNWMYRGLTMLDVSGATHLDRMVWLNLGLDLGTVAVGGSIALLGWWFGRRLPAVGTGIGIVLQGAALFLINARFAAAIFR